MITSNHTTAPDTKLYPTDECSIVASYEPINTITNHPPPPAESADWQNPILFDALNTPDIPAILLPDPVGLYVAELSDHSETPPALGVMVALAVLSSATRGRVSVKLANGHQEPTNIYTAIALPSGNRKSAVFSDLSKPLAAWERSKALAGQSVAATKRSQRQSEEAVIEQRRRKLHTITDQSERQKEITDIAAAEAQLTTVPILPKLYTTDATPESLAVALQDQGGVFSVLSDEGGIFDVLAGLYSNGVSNIDIVLKGWDRGSCRIRRKHLEIDMNPCLTLGLAVQPTTLRNFATKRSFQGRGLAERILFALPKSNLGFRTHDKKAPSESATDSYSAVVQRILNDDRDRVLTLSKAAEDEFADFRGRIEAMLRPSGKLAEFPGWGSKLPGQLVRIAGLMHLISHPTLDEIDQDTMNKTLHLGELLIDHAIAAFAHMGIDQTTLDAQRCWNWISGRTSFTRSELTLAMRHVMKAADLTAALTLLAERHLIDTAEGTPTPRSRLKTHTVNPLTVTP